MKRKVKKIFMISSEITGLAKTGGLADVVLALSNALSGFGHDVKVVIPCYKEIKKQKDLKKIGSMEVPMGNGCKESCDIHIVNLHDSSEKITVQVYLIDHENYFSGRDGIYGNSIETDFKDNSKRFSFFSKAALQLCHKIDWYPDVIHVHDWPTAIVPVYLKYLKESGIDPGSFEKTVSVLSIHNLGYQGIYEKDNFNYMGIDWDLFNKAGFEHDSNYLNMLKAGLCCTDKLNTVSPTYAEEIKTQAYGCGLDGILRDRASDFSGILNGIDTDVWNPSIDQYLTEEQRYSINDMSGKAKAKEALQLKFGLPVNSVIPIIGMVTRLTDQKGIIELFRDNGAIWSIFRDMDIQMVILGSGDKWCEETIKNYASKLYNLKAKIGYSEELAHLVEAGSDFFLMPSRYEPSGLNQMYSLVYGTLPIVRNTGGLADTVENYDETTGNGTGFMFNDMTPQAIYDTVGWAVSTWYDRPQHIEKMQKLGMQKDFSWEKSAQAYVDLYESVLSKNS